MKVRVATPLFSYTGDKAEVEAAGATVDQVMRDLDRRYPGLRFRVIDEQDKIRPHIKIFVNGDQVKDLGKALAPSDTVAIIQAFSGG